MNVHILENTLPRNNHILETDIQDSFLSWEQSSKKHPYLGYNRHCWSFPSKIPLSDIFCCLKPLRKCRELLCPSYVSYLPSKIHISMPYQQVLESISKPCPSSRSSIAQITNITNTPPSQGAWNSNSNNAPFLPQSFVKKNSSLIAQSAWHCRHCTLHCIAQISNLNNTSPLMSRVVI